MYVGVGALSVQTKQNASAALPVCYSERFDKCLDDESRFLPECVPFDPLHVAYEEDVGATDQLVRDMKFCDYSKPQVIKYGILAVGGAFAVGILVGSFVAR